MLLTVVCEMVRRGTLYQDLDAENFGWLNRRPTASHTVAAILEYEVQRQEGAGLGERHLPRNVVATSLSTPLILLNLPSAVHVIFP